MQFIDITLEYTKSVLVIYNDSYMLHILTAEPPPGGEAYMHIRVIYQLFKILSFHKVSDKVNYGDIMVTFSFLVSVKFFN